MSEIPVFGAHKGGGEFYAPDFRTSVQQAFAHLGAALQYLEAAETLIDNRRAFRVVGLTPAGSARWKMEREARMGDLRAMIAQVGRDVERAQLVRLDRGKEPDGDGLAPADTGRVVRAPDPDETVRLRAAELDRGRGK